jgi:hypothetical protein
LKAIALVNLYRSVEFMRHPVYSVGCGNCGLTETAVSLQQGPAKPSAKLEKLNATPLMIQSRRHKYIFVHCPKTAGSSVAVYLSRFFGPMDLNIGSWEDCIASGVRPNLRLFTDAFSPSRILSTSMKFVMKDKPAISILSDSQKKLYRKKFGPKPAHVGSAKIFENDPKTWSDSFKFSIVRNPFARAFSYYRWTERNKEEQDRLSFTEFLEILDEPSQQQILIPNCYDQLSIEGNLAMDFVGRQENLEQDLKTICARIGIPFDPERLPKAKQSGHSVDYRSFFGKTEKKLVESFAIKDLNNFDYAF